MTSSNGNIFRVTDPLWWEPTGQRWIPLTKVSDAELWCFLLSSPEQTVESNNRDAGYLRCHRAHYDVTVMKWTPQYNSPHAKRVISIFIKWNNTKRGRVRCGLSSVLRSHVWRSKWLKIKKTAIEYDLETQSCKWHLCHQIHMLTKNN